MYRGGYILGRAAASLRSTILHRDPVPAAPAFSRSMKIFKTVNKEALAKERERILDEINRGYFDDVRDMNKHKGKMMVTSKELDPPEKSAAFPKFMVYKANQETSFLPTEKNDSPPATLICMSFRASCEEMANSWVFPLREAFPSKEKLQIYEVSWVESGFLSLLPVRKLLLMLIKISKTSERPDRNIVYSFGNSYDARKALNLKNRLAGYMYLVDAEGRVRWRSSGLATTEEASHLIACTTALLQE